MVANFNICKEKSINFAHFQVIIAENLISKIIITGQINIAVNGEYLPWRLKVIIANKS